MQKRKHRQECAVFLFRISFQRNIVNHQQQLPPLALFTSSRYIEDVFSEAAIVHRLHRVQYGNALHAFVKRAAAEAAAAGKETFPCRHLQSQAMSENVAHVSICFVKTLRMSKHTNPTSKSPPVYP